MKMENLELCEAIKEVVNNVLDAGGYQRVRNLMKIISVICGWKQNGTCMMIRGI